MENLIKHYLDELSSMESDMIRQLLSRLAVHTPNSIYFSADFCEQMRSLAAPEPLGELEEGGEIRKGVQMSTFQSAMMFVAAAASADKRISEPGDRITGEVHALVHGGVDIGNYRVTIEKLP